MISDPVPYDPVLPHRSERPKIETNANGIGVILTFKFLKLQTGVRGITLELSKGALRVPLYLHGQG